MAAMMFKFRSLLIFFSLAFIQFGLSFNISEFSAIPSNNMIEVTWRVNDGTNIVKFVLQRSNDEVNWAEVTSLEYIDDATKYLYQDYQMSKKGTPLTTNYYYRLKIVFRDDSSELSPSIMARPKYSGIYRTWGSLKALFR